MPEGGNETISIRVLGNAESGVKATRQAVTGLQQVETQSKRTSSAVKAHARETVEANALLTGSFRSMARQAVLAGGGFAAAYIGISKAKGAIQTTADLARQAEILHRNTGLAVKTTSGMLATLKALGIDSAGVSMSFQTLGRQIVSAETGTKKTQAAFQALGISTRDLKSAHGDLNILLPKIADGFGNLKGNADRLAVSQALLGRGYKSLLPLFAEGAAGFQKQLDTAEKFGAVIDDKTLRQLNALHAAQVKNREASLGLQIAFTTAATPALLALSTVAQKVARDFQGPGSLDEKMSRVGKDLGPALHKIEGVFQAAIPKIANEVGRNASKVALAFVHGFEHADAFGQAALVLFFAKKFGLIGPAFSTAGKAAGAFWTGSFSKTVTTGASEAMAEAAGVTVTMDGATWTLAGAKAGGDWSKGFDAAAATGSGTAMAAGGAVGGAAASKAVWGDLGAIAGKAFQGALVASIAAGLSSAIENALHPSGPNKGGYLDRNTLGMNSLAQWVQSTFGINMPKNHADQNAKSQAQQFRDMMKGGNKRYVDVARRAAITAGVDPGVFLRQINQESGFDPTQVSSMGAIGIAQLVPGTARKLHVDPHNPDASLQAAAKLMGTYLSQFNNNIAKALVAYNAGPGKANLPFNQLPGETQNYLTSILGKGAPGMLAHGVHAPGYSQLLAGLNAKKGAGVPGDLAWARAMVGHFKETGFNTGPELDKLEKEFGMHAAAWCAMFATKALTKAGLPKDILTASVAQLNTWAKAGAKGLAFTTSPQAGDLMTFGNHHVGIVDKVNTNKGTVQVIAGNTSAGKVSRSTYSLSAGKYISVNAAGYTPYKAPKVDNTINGLGVSQQQFLDFVNQRLGHFDLEVQAGLWSAAKSLLAKRSFLGAVLGQGGLTGDTKLQVMAMLRGLQGPTPAQKTWTPFALHQLAMASIQANGGNLGALPAGVFTAAGAAATMQNPWMQAFQQNLTNKVGAGLITQGTSDSALKAVLEKSLPFLFGQDKADAETLLKQIADNTRDTANQMKQQAIGDAGFLGGLTGPAKDAVMGALSSNGIDWLPGGIQASTIIGDPKAAAGLAQQNIKDLMGQVNAGTLTFDQAWPDIKSDLSVIAAATEQTAQNTQDLSDFWKQQAYRLGNSLAVSQSQYGVFSSFNAMPTPYLGGFDSGGIVPGPIGQPGFAMVHGGETILPTHKQKAPIVNVYVSADAQAAGVRVDSTIGRNARQMSVAPGR